MPGNRVGSGPLGDPPGSVVTAHRPGPDVPNMSLDCRTWRTPSPKAVEEGVSPSEAAEEGALEEAGEVGAWGGWAYAAVPPPPPTSVPYPSLRLARPCLGLGPSP